MDLRKFEKTSRLTSICSRLSMSNCQTNNVLKRWLNGGGTENVVVLPELRDNKVVKTKTHRIQGEDDELGGMQ